MTRICRRTRKESPTQSDLQNKGKGLPKGKRFTEDLGGENDTGRTKIRSFGTCRTYKKTARGLNDRAGKRGGRERSTPRGHIHRHLSRESSPTIKLTQFLARQKGEEVCIQKKSAELKKLFLSTKGQQASQRAKSSSALIASPNKADL